MSNSSETKKEKHIALNAMEEAQSWIEPRKDEFIADMKAQLGEGIRKVISERKITSLDNVLIAAIVLVTKEPAEKVVTKLIEAQKKLKAENIDNVVLLATFYDLDLKYLYGDNKDINDEKFPRRLDKVTKLVESESSGSEGGSTETEVGFNLDWSKRNNWDWPDFIEPLNINFTGNQKIKELKAQLSVFTKICYTYEAISAAAGSSRFDSLEYDLAFPFTEKQLSSITFVSPFSSARRHPVYGDVRCHFGVDLAAPSGMEIHSAADGVVAAVLSPSQSGGGGNYVAIQHANGLYTIYMHMTDLIMSNGTQVKKGQVIGHVGSTGASTGPHLHFQVNVGGLSSGEAQDPAIYYKRLGSCPLGTCLADLED